MATHLINLSYFFQADYAKCYNLSFAIELQSVTLISDFYQQEIKLYAYDFSLCALGYFNLRYMGV